MSEDPLRLITTAVDGYRILRYLGSGAAGHVYEAEKDRQPFALKFYKDWLFDAHAEAQERRINNETWIGKIDDPNVCRIYGAAATEVERRMVRYLVMELVEGQSLAELLRTRGALAYHDFKLVARQVISGVQALHKQGIVHRDIKPANVIIERSTGRAVVADFGVIGNLLDALELTDSHEFLGTLRYAAPEWVFRDPAEAAKDPATDVYSIGATFPEMATGNRPYPDVANRGKLILAIRNYPHALDLDGYPPGIGAALRLMLAKEPSLRPSLKECEAMLGSDGVVTVAVQTGGDVTPPELLNFAITPQAVDIRDGPAIFEVTVEAEDDLSGLAAVNVDIRSPKGQQAQGGHVTFDQRALREVRSTAVTVPQYAELGEWRVVEIGLWDKVGNVRQLYPDDLQRQGMPIGLTVVG